MIFTVKPLVGDNAVESISLSVPILKGDPKLMKRPLAYITASWSTNEFENTEDATKYCRKVYEAGFNPICPILSLPLFINDSVPQEHKDAVDIAHEFLRRSNVLVVCGDRVDEVMKSDIAVAERLRITATTLQGILTVKNHGLKSTK